MSNTPSDKCPRCGTDSLIMCLLEGSRAAHAATKRELSNAIDTIDLMRDEFQRIRARIVEKGCDETGLGNEIIELCTRAMSGITQRIPVIAQRDSSEARVVELEKWKSTAKALWRGVMAENDSDLLPAAMLQVGELIELEKQTLGQAMPKKEVV